MRNKTPVYQTLNTSPASLGEANPGYFALLTSMFKRVQRDLLGQDCINSVGALIFCLYDDNIFSLSGLDKNYFLSEAGRINKNDKRDTKDHREAVYPGREPEKDLQHIIKEGNNPGN